jgi:hypothetical protein
MGKKHVQEPPLTAYQVRKLREYESILEATGLNTDRVYDFAQNEPESVVPILRSMIDQAVRSDVVLEYTIIDMELAFILTNHFFGTGKKLQAAKSTKRYKTLNLMLQNVYLMQKLTLVRSFKDIPKSIVSKIAAINDLRNGLAHTFFIEDLKPSKRTYKRHSIFSKKGLEAFHEDAREIRYFFMPWLKKTLEDDEAQT